jgi:hypothetical protein
MHFQPSIFLIFKAKTPERDEYDAKRRRHWKRFLEEEHLCRRLGIIVIRWWERYSQIVLVLGYVLVVGFQSASFSREE